ncbi:hypothetical protein F4780DRAFT_769528 [Xylariomycetidae sp. FL0641]|nr:hypothetical protein F4780DRAFT_769528 [Xylariomycetidae sp. FL0641]
MVLNGQEPSSMSTEATSRLNHYYQLDNERQSFIQAMLQQLEADAKRINELELDLEDQKNSRAQYQSRSLKLEGDVQRYQEKINKGSFVVVLIDGDGAKFADEYLRDPVNGAEKAAQSLRAAVRDHLRESRIGEDHPIVCRVYANLNDLSKSLRLSHVIESDDSMRLFAESFTNSRADFDFVNVGKGKENADSKMRRMLSHYHKNVHCQKIFLAGCCHDNGYLHDLRDFAGTQDSKLVLLETTPAEPGFRMLGFPLLRFDNVFRSQPLNNETKRVAQTMPIRNLSPVQPPPGFTPRLFESVTRLATVGVATSGHPVDPNPMPPNLNASSNGIVQSRRTSSPPGPAQTQSQQTTPSQTHARVQTQAPSQPNRAQTAPQPPVQSQAPSQPPARAPSVINSGNGGMSISYATAGGTSEYQNVTVKASKPKKQPKVIYHNDDSCRIDSQTQHPPKTPAQTTYQAKFQSIKPSVFCNDHYLKNNCRWGISCDKTHDTELTPAELAIHRYKARTSLCPSGPYCQDYDCYLSHHCPRSSCTRGSLCPFYNTARWGDLHYSKDQMQPSIKWTEGSDLPDHVS